MQRSIDTKIQAQVRILLARKWIDLRPLTIGTTNGVVYIGGTLRWMTGAGKELEEGNPGAREGYLMRLMGEIRAISEVQDVVLRFPELEGEPGMQQDTPRRAVNQ